MASRLAYSLASNTGKASLNVRSSDDLARILCEIEGKYLSRVSVLTHFRIVGFLVGILPVTLDLGKGNAFPAVKVIGLFLTINPLIFLVLLNKVFTAGATRQMLRGSRSNAL